MKKGFPVLICLLIICVPAFAQEFLPSRLITLNGDTLSGYLKNSRPKRLSTGCIFRATPNSVDVAYAPDQLRGFESPNGRYISRRLPDGRSVFLLILTQGRLTLLSDGGQGFWVQPAGDSTLIALIRQTVQQRIDRQVLVLPYRYYLDSLFQDCPNERSLTRNLGFTAQALTESVDAYNQCRRAATFKHRFARIINQFGIKVIGTSLLCTYLSYYGENKQSPGSALGVGVLMHTNNDNFDRGRLSSQVELQLIQYSIPEINYRPLYIMAPIVLQYAFRAPQSGWYPYVEAGVQPMLQVGKPTYSQIAEPGSRLSLCLPLGAGVSVRAGQSATRRYGLAVRYFPFVNLNSNELQTFSLSSHLLF